MRRDVGLDLDTSDLSEVGLANIRRELAAAGAAEASARNCLSALRAYAEFRDGARPDARARVTGMQITREQREAWAANTADGPFNRWLDAQVRGEDGRLDAERLHALAEQYGVHRRAEYAHLNAGQQRMNLGNMLRSRVPRSAYETAPDAESSAPLAPPPLGAPIANVAISAPPAAPPRPDFITGARVGELLGLYGQIMDELRARDVVRTGNSPVGDYAELLFARAFDWTLAGNSAAGHDATDADGRRYQIKGRRLTSPSASRQLSAIRKLHEQPFDYLAAVLFDASFKVSRAIILPLDVVAARARRTDHTNSWLFILDDRLWQAPGARDVTAEIAVAAGLL
ncbi:MAG: hypothetical protein JNL41_17610 [Phenylobacterium sp.]|uniref:DUF6998 domain-containing protein n=1 Tax=Phenylobacterium sp. TaxID=1871053 RepID=UPI001A4410B8|nr:hypothetical protein [Phenylobacterium sp.]MBL8556099.1 hypothetical protein [Phenylobacterium sp.]